MPSIDWAVALSAGSTLRLGRSCFEVADLRGPLDQLACGAVHRSIAVGLNTFIGGYCASFDALLIFAFELPTNNARNTDPHILSFAYQVA